MQTIFDSICAAGLVWYRVFRALQYSDSLDDKVDIKRTITFQDRSHESGRNRAGCGKSQPGR